jgi:hypothetical protein
MDVWGEVLLIVYGLPPAIVLSVALLWPVCWASVLGGRRRLVSYWRYCVFRQLRGVCEVSGADRLPPYSSIRK